MFTIPRFPTTCRGIIAHKQINILYRNYYVIILHICCFSYLVTDAIVTQLFSVFVFNHVICNLANNCYYLYCSTYN